MPYNNVHMDHISFLVAACELIIYFHYYSYVDICFLFPYKYVRPVTEPVANVFDKLCCARSRAGHQALPVSDPSKASRRRYLFLFFAFSYHNQSRSYKLEIIGAYLQSESWPYFQSNEIWVFLQL